MVKKLYIALTPSGAIMNGNKESRVASDIAFKGGKVVLTGKITTPEKGKIIPANHYIEVGGEDIYKVNRVSNGVVEVEVVQSNYGAEMLSFAIREPGFYRLGNDKRQAEYLRSWDAARPEEEKAS